MEVNKVFNKVEGVAEVAMGIFSHKCSEVEVEVLKDHRRERAFSMPSRLLLKKYIKVKQVKLLSIEIEFAQVVMVKEEKMELMQLVENVKEEVWSLKCL